MTAEEVSEVQNEQLLKTLIAAKKKIAAYQHLELPSNSTEIKKHIDNHCPVVTKFDLLHKRALFYPNSGKTNFSQIIGKSSGTTGTPLEVIRSLDSILWENAFIKRHWQSICGLKNIKRATLRGDNVVSATQDKKPYWICNKIDKQLILSSRHLNKNTCKDFISVINDYKPDILQAYPSTAFQLAQYALDNKLKIKIPYIFTASEMLYPYQREIIENTIGQVCDFYGMAERVAMATELQKSTYKQ